MLISPGVENSLGVLLLEAAGLANPYGFQHLLGRAQRDAEAVRDAQRQEVLAGLGQEGAVLAIDESGFPKKGTKSAGVARQYCGASGKIDNCQVGVFLSWQTAQGHALLDRALYLPQAWTEDPARCRAAAIPEEVTFATKPELARRLVERALAAGAWRRLTVGRGAKGPRRFEWAAVPIEHPYDPRRWQRWVLVRRSCSDPKDLAFYLAFGPAGAPLEVLARVAGAGRHS